MIIIKRKGCNDKLGDWSKSSDFDCSCNNISCKSMLVTVGIVDAYDGICTILNRKLEILSCYKCSQENYKKFNSATSEHLYGGIVVLKCPDDMRLGDLLIKCRKFFNYVTTDMTDNICICYSERK